MPSKRANRLLVALPIVILAALFGILSLVLIGYETGWTGFLLGFAMAAVPVPFYVTFALWIDRFEPEPPWLLALAFLWGAAIATFFAMISNTINTAIFAAVAGSAAETLGAVLSAPLVEESVKGLALLLLFFWQRDEFDNVTDGIVYATMVGLGFAMTENIHYYGRAVAHSGVGAVGVFLVRGIMGPFCHPLFTSMTGIGLGAARESDNRTTRIVAPLAGLACAMLLHFLWNLSASFGALFFVTYVAIMVPAFIAVLVVAFLSLRREARIIRLHLERVVAAGVVSADDIGALCSVRGRLSATANAFLTGGVSAWRARRAFHRLATELAFHSWHASRGITDDADLSDLLGTVREARLRAGLPPVAIAPPADVVRHYTREQRLPERQSEGLSLVCTAGALAGQRFDVAGGLLLGRDPAAAQIVVSDPRVSKKHAWIGFRDGALVAVDRGSTNGTFVNGVRIQESPVAPGDTVMLSDAAAFELFAAPRPA